MMRDNNQIETPIEDLLPFYGLGALTDEEMARVRAYLEAHPELRPSVDEIQKTVSSLNFTVRPLQPSEATKTRLLDRIAKAQDQDQDVAEPITAESPVPPKITTAEANRANEMPVVAPEDIGGSAENHSPLNGIWSFLRMTLMPLGAAVAVFLILFFGWIRPMSSQLASLTQSNQRLLTESTSQQSQLETLTGQLSAMSLDDLQATLTTQAETLTALTAQVTPLQENNLRLQNEVAALSQQLVLLDEKFTPLQTVNENLQADLQQQNAQLTILTEQLVPLLGDEQTLIDALTDQNEKLTYLSTLATQLAQNNAVLERRVKEQGSAILWATVPNAQAVGIVGLEAHAGAHGQLIANPEGDTGVLIVTGLPQLSVDQVYQLWFINEDQFIAAEIFTVDENGLGMLRIRQDATFLSFQGMGVTIEPDGGSPQPTNAPIMVGEFL